MTRNDVRFTVQMGKRWLRCAGALLIALFSASPLNSGIMAWWEDHLLDVEIVSCTSPSVRNVHLLRQMPEEPLESASLLGHLPPGRIVRARVLRSRIREGSIEPLITGVDAPAKIHPWQTHDSRRPAVYFVPEIRTHLPNPSSTCDRLRRGARLLLIATTASNCDTTPYGGLCLLTPWLSPMRQLRGTERMLLGNRGAGVDAVCVTTGRRDARGRGLFPERTRSQWNSQNDNPAMDSSGPTTLPCS